MWQNLRKSLSNFSPKRFSTKRKKKLIIYTLTKEFYFCKPTMFCSAVLIERKIYPIVHKLFYRQNSLEKSISMFHSKNVQNGWHLDPINMLFFISVWKRNVIVISTFSWNISLWTNWHFLTGKYSVRNFRSILLLTQYPVAPANKLTHLGSAEISGNSVRGFKESRITNV